MKLTPEEYFFHSLHPGAEPKPHSAPETDFIFPLLQQWPMPESIFSPLIFSRKKQWAHLNSLPCSAAKMEKAVPPGKLPDETAGKRSPPPDQYL